MTTITLIALAALLVLIFALEAAFKKSRRRGPVRGDGTRGADGTGGPNEGDSPADAAWPAAHGHSHHTAPDAGAHHGGQSDAGGFSGHGGFDGGGFDGGGGHGH